MVRKRKIWMRVNARILLVILVMAAMFFFNMQNGMAAESAVRVSLLTDGTQGNGTSNSVDISGDGQYVAFISAADNLVPDDTNHTTDVFVYNCQTGDVSRVSVASDGAQGNGAVFEPRISADGRYVAFVSDATNLVPWDDNEEEDIFVHDRVNGTTVRVNVASDGTESNNSSYLGDISADGRYVVFHSYGNNLVDGDTNAVSDVFIHDLQEGTTKRLSIADDGTQGNGSSGIPGFSADGRYVIFESVAKNLIPNDTNDKRDIFRCHIETGELIRVSVASDGTQGNNNSFRSSISGDGRYAVFDSYATNFTLHDNNGSADIFVHDCQTGETVLVSVSSDNIQGDNESQFNSISSDGRYIVFGSYSENLIVGGTNQVGQVYIRDCLTGETALVSKAADGSQGNDYSGVPVISSDGNYIVYESDALNLTANDTNNVRDIVLVDLHPELPAATLSIESCGSITLTQTGTVAAGDVQYQNSAAVIAALPSTATVTLEDKSTTDAAIRWSDTDQYNASSAGSYTFTAVWGDLPNGVDNDDNIQAPVVEVMVAPGSEVPAEFKIPNYLVYDYAGNGSDYQLLPLSYAVYVPLTPRPEGIAFDDQDNLFIVAGDRIHRVEAAGDHIMEQIREDGGDYIDLSDLSQSCGIDADQNGVLYVTDMNNHRICRIDVHTGLLTTVAGGTSGYFGDGGLATAAAMFLPSDVEVDDEGNIYISDVDNGTVRFVDSNTGIISTIAGTGIPGFSGDGGPAVNAQLDYPSAIDLDGAGNLYIADSGNNRIRMLEKATGHIYTVAGTGQDGFSGDMGLATGAALSLPCGIAVNNKGNLFISDTNNNRIRMVDKTTGTIFTIAGNGLAGYSGWPYQATVNRVSFPTYLDLDRQGNVYFSDRQNKRVRMLQESPLLTPPVLTADVPRAVGNAVTFTFADQNGWYRTIKQATIGNQVISWGYGLYTNGYDQITLPSWVLTAPGEYRIVISATGYTDAVVTQTMIASSGGGGHSSHSTVSSDAPLEGSEKGTVSITASSDFDRANRMAAASISSETLTNAFRGNSAGEQVEKVEIAIPGTVDAEGYQLTVPAEFLTSADSERAVKIQTVLADVTLPSNMISSEITGAGSNVSVTVSVADRAALPADVAEQIGDRPILELNLSIDGQPVAWQNEESPVTVSVPYEPSEAELQDPEHITVWYVDGQGNAVSVSSGRYDPETGRVTFTTTHFSKYAVVYVKKTFQDLNCSEWARTPIEVLASKGIINGVTATKYQPDGQITRGDFIKLLIDTLGINASFDQNFEDVSVRNYGYNEIGIAKKLGIAGGIGGNQFQPKQSITRQDMMVMTDRALRVANKNSQTGQDNGGTLIGQFIDRNEISQYALFSVEQMVREGYIKGSGSIMNPKSETTRAEAAVFLYRVYQSQ